MFFSLSSKATICVYTTVPQFFIEYSSIRCKTVDMATMRHQLVTKANDIKKKPI